MTTALKTFAEKARAAWGADLPDWVAELADEADRTTGAAVSRKIGYSDSLASQVISRSYRGDLGSVEAAVRGAIMGLTVECPALRGAIGRELCLRHQKQPLSTASPSSVKLYHACRAGCPHSRIKRSEG
jgi:hypothetical protein